MSTDTIDVTSRDSSNWREFLAGLRDGGEVTFDIIFDPDDATHDDSTGLQSLHDSGALTEFQIGWPNSNTLTFDAIVTGFGSVAPLNDAFTADVTLKVSGKPTWA